MTPLGALLVLGIVVLAGAALGIVVSRRRVRSRDGDGAILTAEQLGADLPPASQHAVVLFSTVYCARCPAVDRDLQSVFGDREDVVLRHVDLTDTPERAADLHILQTPTVFIVNDRGALVSRLSGSVTARSVLEHLPTNRPKETHSS